MDIFVESLRCFWDKGVKKVSPGALSMHVSSEYVGTSVRISERDMEMGILPRVREKAEWDGTWLILKERP